MKFTTAKIGFSGVLATNDKMEVDPLDSTNKRTRFGGTPRQNMNFALRTNVCSPTKVQIRVEFFVDTILTTGFDRG